MKVATATLCSALAFTAALIAASADGAAQQVPCKQHGDVHGHLAQKYQELPVAAGEGWHALPPADAVPSHTSPQHPAR